MKIELNNNIFKIFILKLDKLNDKNYIINYIKDVVISLQHLLSLSGFYKVKVYPKERIGIFIEIIKIDDVAFSDSIDLRVNVLYDEDIYFVTYDFDKIKDCSNIEYLDGCFYCKVDESFDNIFSRIEFGKFIFGEDVKNIVKKLIKL